MISIKKTKYTLITTIFFTIVLLAIYIWIYIEVSRFESRLDGDKKKLQELGIELEQVKKMQDNIKTTISKRDVLFSHFIPSDSLVGFIENVEKIVRDTNSFGVIDTVTEKPYDLGNQKFSEVLIFITLQGSWQSALSAINLFELLPYKVSINNFNLEATESLDLKEQSITNSEKINSNKLWKANLTLSVISLK